ncbi:hypothetical protein [Streptomyces sp. B6B3]|uniref:hypothetical protein n=1 Tax=Streptomyces sp. B6B3 TaxID=3153570 RepID=UPI00325E636C
MMDLERKVNQVWHQEVRPLVAEAYRCYTTGSARACMVLTWTAVCTDLIHKLYQLAEDEEGEAKAVVQRIDEARQKPDREAVRTMLDVENTILEVAEKLDLVDFVQRRELERLKEDRNLAAHPSLRPLGELFTPSTEYARAHLTAAVDALLIHPPSQGRKAVERFREHVQEVSFVGSPVYLTQTFFDRVKSATRRNIVVFAVKEALLELSSHGALDAGVMSDRYAACVRAFAGRDGVVVQRAIASVVGRLGQQPLERQIRALVRLGDLNAFWEEVDEAMKAQLADYAERIAAIPYQPLTVEETSLLGLVEIPHIRQALPSLEEKFRSLSPDQQASVIAHNRAGPYLSDYVAGILTAAGSWRMAESLARSAVPSCAPHLDVRQLGDILSAWAENYECRTAAAMPELAVRFYSLVPSAVRGDEAWQVFLRRVRELEEPDSPFRYTELEQAIQESSGPMA